MSNEEFSDEFDVLLNSFSKESGSQVSIELDEYEKSVFLTKAQNDIIISLYNGKNRFGDSFENTEEIRRYLSSIIKTVTISQKESGIRGLSELSSFFKLPDDLLFITYESVDIDDDRLGCLSGKNVGTIPITQDDYQRIKDNPFKGASKKRVLRLDVNNNIVEIVSNYNVSSYLVRYLSKPNPIILEELPSNLTISGISAKTECKLNPALHRMILERAVRDALLSRFPNAGK